MNVEPLKIVDDRFSLASAHRWHGKQDIGYAEALHFGNQIARMIHRAAVQTLATQPAIVVDKSQKIHARIMPRRQSKLLPRAAGAVNQNAFGFAAKGPLSKQITDDVADHDPAKHQSQKEEDGHKNANSSGHTRQSDNGEDACHQKQENGHGAGEFSYGARACEPENGPVDAKCKKDRRPCEERHQQDAAHRGIP